MAEVAHAQLTLQSIHESRSGPLPDPNTLKEYEEILPKGADRIFTMAEREQSFAHTYNLKNQEIRSRASLLGQIFGFVLGVIGIIGAVVLSIYGKDVGSGIMFIGSVGTLIATAIWGRKSPAKGTSDQKA